MSDQELWDRNYEEFLKIERKWDDLPNSDWGNLNDDGWDDFDEEDDWR